MTDIKKVLVADDDPLILKMVDKVLSAQGYKVLTASDGQEALRVFFEEKPDLVLLDAMMPKLNGWDTCSRIRDVSDVPVVLFTGQGKTEEDIVRGLDYGADEYLFKPIGNKELVARVKAILRRSERDTAQAKKDTSYRDNYLTINVAEHTVLVNGKRVKMTPREFRMLACLVEHAGQVVSIRQLLERVWGWEYIDDVDYVRIYISHLRKKIEPNPDSNTYIITEPGFGYQFRRQV